MKQGTNNQKIFCENATKYRFSLKRVERELFPLKSFGWTSILIISFRFILVNQRAMFRSLFQGISFCMYRVYYIPYHHHHVKQSDWNKKHMQNL